MPWAVDEGYSFQEMHCQLTAFFKLPSHLGRWESTRSNQDVAEAGKLDAPQRHRVRGDLKSRLKMPGLQLALGIGRKTPKSKTARSSARYPEPLSSTEVPNGFLMTRSQVLRNEMPSYDSSPERSRSESFRCSQTYRIHCVRELLQQCFRRAEAVNRAHPLTGSPGKKPLEKIHHNTLSSVKPHNLNGMSPARPRILPLPVDARIAPRPLPQHAQQRDSQRPHVVARTADLLRPEYFRREEQPRAPRRSGGQIIHALDVGEVSNDNVERFQRSEEDVARLDVGVDEAAAVEISESRGHLVHDK